MSIVGAAQREIETLGRLADELPDAYTVYHGVHWTRLERGWSVFGEIDFCIVNPAGRMLLIEQKSGFLDETPDGLVKSYPKKGKLVRAQMARTADGLRGRFSQAHPHVSLLLDYVLYCPDYTVRNPDIAGIAPERIVDATRRDQLSAIVRSILPADEPPCQEADKVHRFLGDQLKLVPDVGALAGRAEVIATQLSGGLATWARRLQFQPFRLRVVGTAGSGKTQLALAAYQDTVNEGKRPLYVCFNRPLADHMSAIVPSGGEVATFHQLCDRLLRARGFQPDFSDPDAFLQLEVKLAEAEIAEDWRFDTLIVDEGQDFSEAWCDQVLRFIKPGGKAFWLEDPMQSLYGRPPVKLPDWVILQADTNYRSPRDVLDYVNQLAAPERPIESGCPLVGSDIEIDTYTDPPDLIEVTKRAITRCIGLGYKKEDMAIVTFRGRENSHLLQFTKLGPHSLRSFSGRYDLLGDPIYRAGDILIETIYRFKGQAAPCIIFTEIDFAELDNQSRRKLFVGMTRATMKLTLILSESAATKLMEGMS